VKTNVAELTNSVQLEKYKKKMAKTKQVILNFVKDHLIPHIAENTTGKKMFDVLVTLYQSKNINQKMLLRNKLRVTQMSNKNTVACYLTKIIKLHDQLAIVG
jgi:hypothetical protein